MVTKSHIIFFLGMVVVIVGCPAFEKFVSKNEESVIVDSCKTNCSTECLPLKNCTENCTEHCEGLSDKKACHQNCRKVTCKAEDGQCRACKKKCKDECKKANCKSSCEEKAMKSPACKSCMEKNCH
uniref:Vanadium-binding protein 4 n=1 Tax=Ascidia sydneiensis samea TaxID=79730 RepID=A7VMV6_ASCSS|nr:vanadium-binding protein 4 [Ascidia sydneiensis samea]